MAKKSWRPVHRLMALRQLTEVEFRLSRDEIRRARRVLMVEASHGRVLKATERPDSFMVQIGNDARTYFERQRAVRFRVITPREQARTLVSRLRRHVGLWANDPYHYIRTRDLPLR